MDLFQNPFYILSVSPRDNYARIMDSADERSLLLDAEECTSASLSLTTPRKRIVAEAAWLPGIAPKYAEELISILETCPANILAENKLSPVARANVLAAALIRLPEYNVDEIVKWIIALAEVFEEIDPEKLKNLINEERVVAGFPEIIDLSVVEEEIQNQKRYYCQVIKTALDNLESRDLVKAVTTAVETITDIGEEYCPSLIVELVNAYEVEAQGFLDKEEENILILIKNLQSAIETDGEDFALELMVDKLIQVVKNWDFVAQPIQVCTKSQGLEHEASIRVAKELRNLAIEMHNEHDKFDLCQKIISMLQEVFAEVVEIAELAEDDANTLDELADQRARWIAGASEREEEWKNEITYEAEVGVIFKNKLRISPEGVEWQGCQLPLDSITLVRWGGTSHSVNGIPTGTTYSIVLGNDSRIMQIELRKSSTFNNFIACLWKAVGIRILTDYLKGLRKGKKYLLGSALLCDAGMEIERTGFFSKKEHVFCHWEELEIWNIPGSLCIGKKGDRGLIVTYSYQGENNIHILDAMIRMLFDKGEDRLSNLLKR